ncbi:DUF3102 domain-containing protein [Staphylococcus felis]|uniref:DUF3102 domain-containing protein n=1 Tax=Staphylococcus felis TaxID=46127 RepID=UPI0039676A01
MNGLELSNNLTTIETEIKSYQNVAGQSIFEIGRRLKHVKENDLVHGEWIEWLNKVNLDRNQATKFIKIANEFQDDWTSNHLGVDALYQIATLPELERTKEHVTSSGKTKTPDEMTVRELRELKKQLKQRNEQNAQLQAQVKQAQRSEELAIKQLEDEQSKLAETKIEYKEIIPDDIKKQMKDNEMKLEAYEQERKDKDAQIKRLREKIRNDKQKFETSGTLTDDEKIASLRLRAETNLLEICEDTNEFLDKVSHTAFREAAVAKSSDRTKNLLFDSVENLEAWCKQMRQILNSSEIIEEAIYSEQY